MRKLMLGLMISAVAVPATAQSVREGIDAWQNGDEVAAVYIWRPLAEDGDADAAFNLGQAYRLGRGVPADQSMAQKWLEQAARAGHVKAQSVLGLMLFQNGNQQSALLWLNSAAKRGDARALLMVGTALYNGETGKRDPIKAYAYVSRAAAQGLAPAKTTLASMDEAMPLDQRVQGTAMAQEMVEGSDVSEMPEAAPKPAPKKKPAPVRIAEVEVEDEPAEPKPVAPKPAPKPTVKLAAKPAAPKPAPARAEPFIVASGDWRIQLGAFGQRSSAQALFAKVSGKLPGRRAFYIPVGAVTRLQVGPFESKAAASAACARAGTACFVVPAK